MVEEEEKDQVGQGLTAMEQPPINDLGDVDSVHRDSRIGYIHDDEETPRHMQKQRVHNEQVLLDGDKDEMASSDGKLEEQKNLKSAKVKKKLKGIKSEGKLRTKTAQMIELEHEIRMRPDISTPHNESSKLDMAYPSKRIHRVKQSRGIEEEKDEHYGLPNHNTQCE